MAARKTNPRRRKYYEHDYKTGQSKWVTRPIPSDKKKGNPMPVAGRKVKGGRAVSVKNFTGTITRKNDGTVIIRGRKK